MSDGYTLYVDESGDSGTTNIRSDSAGGQTPFMVLGAVLIANDNKDAYRETLCQISDRLGLKNLHCKKMKHHHKKVYYAKEVSKLDLTCFGLISYKRTPGQYEDIKAQGHRGYYHRCIQHLLEQLCRFIKEQRLDAKGISVVFERSNSLDLCELRNLIHLCISSPRNEASRILAMLDTSKFQVMPKKSEPLLQFADLVAHSLFQCVEKSDGKFGITEPRYVNELRNRFWANPESEKVFGCGIRAIGRLSDFQLDEDIDSFFRDLEST